MPKQPVIPSLLYTEGTTKVNEEIEEELKVPDPTPEVAKAAVCKACRCRGMIEVSKKALEQLKRLTEQDGDSCE